MWNDPAVAEAASELNSLGNFIFYGFLALAIVAVLWLLYRVVQANRRTEDPFRTNRTVRSPHSQMARAGLGTYYRRRWWRDKHGRRRDKHGRYIIGEPDDNDADGTEFYARWGKGGTQDND